MRSGYAFFAVGACALPLSLFFAGCGADQNPLPRRTVDLAEGYGKQLADAVDAVVKAPMATVGPTLKTTYATINIPFGELPTREKIVQDTMSKNPYIVSRAKILLKDLEKNGTLKQTYPYPVQTWQLGNDLTWVALGGEVVVDYSLRLKKELGKVWVTGLGLPSEMGTYVTSGVIEQFGLWNPEDLGFLASYAADALIKGTITGKEGDKFTAGKLGSFTVGKGGEVVLGPMFVFDKSNVGNFSF